PLARGGVARGGGWRRLPPPAERLRGPGAGRGVRRLLRAAFREPGGLLPVRALHLPGRPQREPAARRGDRHGWLHRAGGLLAGVILPAGAQVAGPGNTLTPTQAAALLDQPARMESGAAQVLRRVAASYGKLKSLETETTSGNLSTLARMQRPGFFNLMHR